MAVTDALASDYRAATQACALVDRSERGKLLLAGPDAKSFLQGQLTNDVEALQPGRGCYAAFLTHKGKMLGDLRVLDAGPGVWLDTERPVLQELFNMIRRFKLGADVELHKRTLERFAFSLVGPRARDVAGAEDLPLEEHAHRLAELGAARVRLVATDLGVDVIGDSDAADAVRAALEERGAVPGDEAVAEVLRVERGRPRYGLDMDDTTIPQEAGLNDRAVSFTKGCYVGQETVARLFYRGKPNRHLRGLRLASPASTGEAILLADREVGRVGSAAVSPVHGPIALALVRREAGPGTRVTVGEGGEAEVVELPFDAA